MTMRVSATAAKKATGAAFFAAALGIGIIAFSAQTERLGDSSWKGYRVLLVDESVPETEVLESLKGAGFDKVLSESTEPVLVSYWAEPETIGLAAARARLAPGDLRLDAYLQRLSLWFEARVGGAAYRAFYVGTEPSFAVAGINRRMKETLKGFAGRFVLADAGNPVPTKSGATLPFALAAVLLIASAVIGPLIGKKSISIRGLLERKTGRQISDRIAFRLVLLMPWAALASGGLSAAALGALWGLAFAEFADRLDNLSDLEVMPKEKQLRVAFETLEIYAPIAERLGLYAVKLELEDLGFRALYPYRYKVLERELAIEITWRNGRRRTR